MRKIYCDICGKEIASEKETWSIGVVANSDNLTISYNELRKDVCELCAIELSNCILMMREVGWRPDFHEAYKSDNIATRTKAECIDLYEKGKWRRK